MAKTDSGPRSNRKGSKKPALIRTARDGKPTEDEKLLAAPTYKQPPLTQTQPWRVFLTMPEFVEGFDALADLDRAVTIFGSARIKPGDPVYQAAVDVARMLGEAGFTIITGGGPGIMEAGNLGARQAGVRSVGLNV